MESGNLFFELNARFTLYIPLLESIVLNKKFVNVH